jgi:general secretion pathway protein K
VGFPCDDDGYDAMSRQCDRFPRGRKTAGEHGSALLVVLWIFIFLFVVAFEFSASVREEAAAAHRYRDETQGYYLAMAGFERALYDLLNRQPGAGLSLQSAAQDDPFDGDWREESLGAATFRFRLIDQGGKININRVNEVTLQRIFTNLGVDVPWRDILVDSIMDWRDPDDFHRASGAESDYYLARTPPYTAKNGPFDSVEELLWVRGVTAELFYGYSDYEDSVGDNPRRIALREIFTVDSPIDRVNLRTAGAEVIHALSGIPLERCRAFVEERKRLSDKTLADLLPLLGLGSGDPMLQLFVFTNPSVIAVEAEGRAGDSAQPRRIKGVVRLGGARGFELLRWLDRDIALSQS